MLDSIRTIAESLWVCHVMSAFDDEDCFYPEAWQAGSGDDWFDTVPTDHLPDGALGAALRCFESIAWKVDFESDCAGWCEETGQDEDRFWHCIAMQWLGTGVGLCDDVHYDSDYVQPTIGRGEYDR